jgi:aminoglycoside phosphotransferase (APT) family kinase protein
MLVMAEAPGERDLNLWVKLLEHERPLPTGVDLDRLERCMAVVAKALAELHRSGIHPTETRSFQSELADQCRDLALMRNGDTALGREIERVVERLKVHALHDEPHVPCHGGFRHKQLMGNDRHLTLLDWDGLTLAHPALDAATFIARLRYTPIIEPGRCSQLEHLAGVFRREFLTHEPEVDLRQLKLYEALVLTEFALRAFRRPRLKEQVISCVRHLIAEAERLLDE